MVCPQLIELSRGEKNLESSVEDSKWDLLSWSKICSSDSTLLPGLLAWHIVLRVGDVGCVFVLVLLQEFIKEVSIYLPLYHFFYRFFFHSLDSCGILITLPFCEISWANISLSIIFNEKFCSILKHCPIFYLLLMKFCPLIILLYCFIVTAPFVHFVGPHASVDMDNVLDLSG